MKSELILIRGLPGSGKSTLAKRLAEQGYFHIEADMYFIDDGGNYRFESDKLPEAHAFCLQMARLMLQRGVNVVVANTFTTHEEMIPYAKIAWAQFASLRVIECEGDFGSLHGVPKETIDNMRARWETLSESSKTSWFDTIESEVIKERRVF